MVMIINISPTLRKKNTLCAHLFALYSKPYIVCVRNRLKFKLVLVLTDPLRKLTLVLLYIKPKNDSYYRLL